MFVFTPIMTVVDDRKCGEERGIDGSREEREYLHEILGRFNSIVVSMFILFYAHGFRTFLRIRI